MRVGPTAVPLPEEEYAPETETPEPSSLPEYAPVEYEVPGEGEYDFEPTEVPAQTRHIFPTDVRRPTDEDAFVRFDTEFVQKRKPGRVRDAALAWRAYLLNPEGAPYPGQVVKRGEGEKDVVREVENILANEYGIEDPIHGYAPPDVLRRGPRPGTKRKKRVYDPIQAEKMFLVRQGVATASKQRKAQRTQAAKEMRYLRKTVKPPKPPKKP